MVLPACHEAIIDICGLEKAYRVWYRREKIQALHRIDLQVRKGEIFGFLGPNGAGKTTTVKLLLGLLRPDGGSVEILNGRPGDLRVKTQIGYMPERALLPNYLTLREMLLLFGGLSGLAGIKLKRAVEQAVGIVELSDVIDRSLDTFSKGMLQRATLAQSLVHDPELLLLDEPAIGLDPIARRRLRDLLLNLRARGKTIFLNSHELEVVQLVCDRFAILDKGRILTIQSIDTLRQLGKFTITMDHVQPMHEKICHQIPGVLELDHDRKQITAVAENARELNRIIDDLRVSGILITSIQPVTLSLEELFLRYVNDNDDTLDSAAYHTASHVHK